MVMLGNQNKWIKASDVRDGDTVTFTTEGGWQTSTKFVQPDKFKDGTPNPNAGQPQKSFVIDVLLNDKEEMQMTLNATNREILMEAFGKDTMQWCNKKATIGIQRVKGKNGLENRIVLKADVAPKDPSSIEWNE